MKSTPSTGAVERYEPFACRDSFGNAVSYMDPEETGRFVLYTDYERLAVELEAVRAAYDASNRQFYELVAVVDKALDRAKP